MRIWKLLQKENIFLKVQLLDKEAILHYIADVCIQNNVIKDPGKIFNGLETRVQPYLSHKAIKNIICVMILTIKYRINASVPEIWIRNKIKPLSNILIREKTDVITPKQKITNN